MTAPGSVPAQQHPLGPARAAGAEAQAVVGWLLVAGATRFWFLGEWSLWGDEAFTLIDVEALADGVWRHSVRTWPLFFLLELPFLTLLRDALGVEAAARFLPALCGALVPAVMFVGTRPWLRRGERHLLAGLFTVSPWLLFHAQFARHYAPLLLASSLAILQVLRALRADRPGPMAWACLWLFVAGMLHPTAWALLAGALLLAWRAPGLPARPSVRTLTPLLALLALMVLVLLLRQESVRATLGYKLRHRDAGAESLPDLVLGITYNVGMPVALLAVLGVGSLWRRDRFLAGAVLWIAAPTLAVLLGMAAAGTWVEQRYWIPVIPLVFLPAAVVLGDLTRGLRTQGRLVAAVPACLAFAAYLPGMASHYRDGDRPDLRGAARAVVAALEPGEFVLVENHVLFLRYAPELGEELVQEAPPRPGDGLAEFRQAMREATGVWVVLPDTFRRAGGARSEFYRWASSQGRLMTWFHAPRLDYHQNRISVFHVDARTAERFRTSER